ncbi:helix-turn-helix domain-containing protein [Streptococcus gallolyticus]|uniref:helix-turn-helix domain-containing protein n=1 Tax=Streptococcus gallolyticus TaxID=315405 RepID=UPI00228520C9|nr:helix-turn-helix transcriptional regulator [Streptococcus gallolyticus]MCY7164614.1 helix-turn-helix domain-containing protein [Streptococcus gallolyticus subsp. gallolyticus]MCY7183433.1 helix-turn-helix domain-containing protein [Streptococcus gallolyticus subsp. gallolyticus]
MELERRLVELRKEKNLSQEELAEKLYVSRQTISNWERGKTYPDINSLLLIATYFGISLDNLIKGDVDIMKHQVDQSQFKKWLIIGGISWFLFSVEVPTRYLLDSGQATAILWLLAMPVAYSAFQILYILKNRELQTYADILNFLNPKKNVKTSILSELWFVVSVIVIAFIIFFAGTVISALIFHY